MMRINLLNRILDLWQCLQRHLFDLDNCNKMKKKTKQTNNKIKITHQHSTSQNVMKCTQKTKEKDDCENENIIMKNDS